MLGLFFAKISSSFSPVFFPSSSLTIISKARVHSECMTENNYLDINPSLDGSIHFIFNGSHHKKSLATFHADKIFAPNIIITHQCTISLFVHPQNARSTNTLLRHDQRQPHSVMPSQRLIPKDKLSCKFGPRERIRRMEKDSPGASLETSPS